MRYLRGLTDLLLDDPTRPPFAGALHELRRAGLSAWQLAAVLGQVVTAGRDPVVSLCATTYLEVVGAPSGQAASVPAGGHLLDAAVQRALHHEPPFRHLHRTVTESCRCAEPALGGGSTVSIDIAAVQQDSTAEGRPWPSGTARTTASAQRWPARSARWSSGSWSPDALGSSSTGPGSAAVRGPCCVR